MSEVLLKRLQNGAFIPADTDSADGLARIKPETFVRCTITKIRNVGHHRKWFTLVGMLYDMWSERMSPQTYRGVEVLPNKDRFRRDLIIMTGRYNATYDVMGGVHLEAHSISFANMGQDEFEKLYSDTIQVALSKIIGTQGLTEDELRRRVDLVMQYD